MAITLDRLKRILQARVDAAGGVRKFGRLSGVGPARVSEALRGIHEPTPQVAAALGYRKSSSKWEKVS